MLGVVVDAALPRHHYAPYRRVVKLPAACHPVLDLDAVGVVGEVEVDIGVGELGGVLVPGNDEGALRVTREEHILGPEVAVHKAHGVQVVHAEDQLLNHLSRLLVAAVHLYKPL